PDKCDEIAIADYRHSSIGDHGPFKPAVFDITTDVYVDRIEKSPNGACNKPELMLAAWSRNDEACHRPVSTMFILLDDPRILQELKDGCRIDVGHRGPHELDERLLSVGSVVLELEWHADRYEDIRRSRVPRVQNLDRRIPNSGGQDREAHGIRHRALNIPPGETCLHRQPGGCGRQTSFFEYRFAALDVGVSRRLDEVPESDPVPHHETCDRDHHVPRCSKQVGL